MGALITTLLGTVIIIILLDGVGSLFDGEWTKKEYAYVSED